MLNIDVDLLRTQMLERRQKLHDAAQSAGRPEELIDLLKQVDFALEKMNKGTYGLCETCHESIEPERLIVDPLIKNCLDHLTAIEQRMLERDLDLAFSVQSNLLPKQGMGAVGWTTAYHFAPAGPVSGDYCDLIVQGNNEMMYFFIGDVSGKGVAASILMAHLHALFRSFIRPGSSISQVLAQVNRLFCESTALKNFATLVCGSVNPQGTVELCNAAHCKPLIMRSGNVEPVSSTSFPLGIFAHSSFTTQQYHLDHRDTLLLYTDGLIEARNSSGELYGEDRLISLAKTLASLSPSEVIAACLNDLTKFVSGEKRIDDLTLLVLQRKS